MRKWYHDSSTLRELMAPSELSRSQAFYIRELPLARTRISRLQHFWRCPQFLKVSTINSSLPWLNLIPSLGWDQFLKSALTSKLRELGKAVILALVQFSKAFCPLLNRAFWTEPIFGWSHPHHHYHLLEFRVMPWLKSPRRVWLVRSCMYIVRGSPSFLLHRKIKSFYPTFHSHHHHQPHCRRPQPLSQLSALVLRLLSSLPTWSSLRPNKAQPLQVL